MNFSICGLLFIFLISSLVNMFQPLTYCKNTERYYPEMIFKILRNRMDIDLCVEHSPQGNSYIAGLRGPGDRREGRQLGQWVVLKSGVCGRISYFHDKGSQPWRNVCDLFSITFPNRSGCLFFKSLPVGSMITTKILSFILYLSNHKWGHFLRFHHHFCCVVTVAFDDLLVYGLCPFWG